MFDVHVDVHGPLFDGRAQDALHEFMHEAVWEITKEGRGDLGVQFIKVFREPTGHYESRVEAVRPVSIGAGAVQSRLHDNARGDVVYNFWLEGIGSRNYPVTRFKGYHSFREVAQELQRKASRIAERVLPRFIQRMGG